VEQIMNQPDARRLGLFLQAVLDWKIEQEEPAQAQESLGAWAQASAEMQEQWGLGVVLEPRGRMGAWMQVDGVQA
jgi:hypothetical protein